MQYLLFVDTNVLLDFYRSSTDVGLHLLDKLDRMHTRTIISYQVEMEFKKNRQKVILDALKKLDRTDSKAEIPAFLRGAKAIKSISRSRERIASQVHRLRTRTQTLMANPTTNDPVYKPIQRLFRDQTPYNLSREKKERYKIRRLAKKRFILGYPPRKERDTSIGDAVNWEWIVECATQSGDGVVIASRDSDYGITFGEASYLNDWLLQEFRSRVSKKRPILLTSKLTEAFKLMNVGVSSEEEKEEAKLIEARRTRMRPEFGYGTKEWCDDIARELERMMNEREKAQGTPKQENE